MIVENRNFMFTANYAGKVEDLIVSVPCASGYAITCQFCPKELLPQSIFKNSWINGESIEEFIKDCKYQVDNFDGEDVKMSHYAGLKAAVIDHIGKYNRLIFNDLLVYMDCYCLLLNAVGYSENELSMIYIQDLKRIVDVYSEYIKDTQTLCPFKNSQAYSVLINL